MPTRGEQRQQALARVVEVVAAAAGMAEPAMVEVLDRVGALEPQRLWELDAHLASHPDALVSGASDCPLVLVKLIHTLLDTGASVTAPRCGRCGRTSADLPAVRPGGRICLPCYRQEKKTPCARCGRITKAAYRRPEGLVCASCRNAEPATRGTCPSCDRERPLRRGRDGSLRCDTCSPRPQRVCTECSRSAPAVMVTESGPVCARCYQQPQRRCGGCGQVRVIIVRATAEHPDLCQSCRPRTVGTCAGCGRHTFGAASRRGHGPFYCQTCQPKAHHTCVRCGHHRPAQALWPAGPVCKSCYSHAKNHPAACGRCGQIRVLTGRDPQGRNICGRCAGAANDYTCRVCGQGDQPPWRDGMCARCVLSTRVDDLLGTDPTGQWRPLAAALKRVASPVYLLRWLSDRPTGQLLQHLAAEARPISHRLLDDLPARAEVHYLRHILVRAGTLPDRTEYLDRITPWLAQRLAQCPPSHAQIVRPFARWFLLHRARRTAQTRGYTPQASYKLRSHILAVLEFLAWLDSRGLDLGTASQADIDAWLTTGPPSRRYRVRGFLDWARQRGTAGELTIPGRTAQYQPLRPLPDDEVWAQLRRCLHDPNIPLDVRVAGALILLFGTTVTRLVRLNADAVVVGDAQVHLRLGRAPLLLPPPVDELATGLAQAPVEHSAFTEPFGPSRRQFPGRAPGHPIRAPALRARLTRNGITPVPGRHAAILALTGDLPTPVVADLLGVSYKTAIRWAAHTGADWNDYVSARDESTRP